jgi:glyoxylase-like metal-dependent hydrolase (beta-lactamase superfamily II)
MNVFRIDTIWNIPYTLLPGGNYPSPSPEGQGSEKLTQGHAFDMNNSDLMIQTFHTEEGRRNEYLIVNNGEAAVVDPAHAADDMTQALETSGYRLEYVLLTHGYRPLIQAVPVITSRLGGRFGLHPRDGDLLAKTNPSLPIDIPLKEGTRLTLGTISVKVLHTPGHSMGSVCFYIPKQDILFSGETVLKGAFGRIWGTDSMRLMAMSLKRLYGYLPMKTRVFPSHGPGTIMKDEAWMNCLRSA